MKKAVFYILLLTLPLVILEAGLWAVASFLQNRGVLYVEQSVDDYAQYMKRRDPVLGWPPRPLDPSVFDAYGARVDPAWPDPGRAPACLSLYGDSFTFSAEVAPDAAWSARLSRLLGCRVANYGIGGYGTDQAFLRFEQNKHDRAPIVILGHLSENIVRNVNQFRNLLRSGTRYGLKPRFVIGESGRLEPVPLPSFTKEEYAAMVRAPEDYLDHEFFARFSFPYTLSLFSGRNLDQITARLSSKPWYWDFYEPDHPSGALGVTEKIILAFRSMAVRQGRRPIVLVLPTRDDLDEYRRSGAWAVQPLLEGLENGGVEYIHAGPPMARYIRDRDPAELFRLSHYNEEGEWLLALIVYRHLLETR